MLFKKFCKSVFDVFLQSFAPSVTLAYRLVGDPLSTTGENIFSLSGCCQRWLLHHPCRGNLLLARSL